MLRYVQPMSKPTGLESSPLSSEFIGDHVLSVGDLCVFVFELPWFWTASYLPWSCGWVQRSVNRFASNESFHWDFPSRSQVGDFSLFWFFSSHQRAFEFKLWTFQLFHHFHPFNLLIHRFWTQEFKAISLWINLIEFTLELVHNVNLTMHPESTSQIGLLDRLANRYTANCPKKSPSGFSTKVAYRLTRFTK